MTTFRPDGWHSITPRFFTPDPAALVAFLRHAFRATGDFNSDRPTELRVGDSVLMVSDVAAREPMPAFLYLYLEDIDAAFARAVEAGAEVLEEPRDLPYGDRRAMLKDPAGNIWQIATRLPR